MSNDKNIWGLLKKKNILTIGYKPGQSSKPVEAQKANPPKVKPIKATKVKAKRVKVPKVEAQAVQAQQASQELQLSDFKIQFVADTNNLYVTITYQGTPIHALILPARDFFGWQRATPQQRYAYIQARVNPATFNNDLRLVQIIITSYVRRIDALFARAHQQQAQAKMAQQAQVYRRYDSGDISW